MKQSTQMEKTVTDSGKAPRVRQQPTGQMSESSKSAKAIRDEHASKVREFLAERKSQRCDDKYCDVHNPDAFTGTVTDSGNAPSVISSAEFYRLCAQFPNVTQASYQAGCGEYFVAEWRNGSQIPSRLVHYFSPIL